MSRMLNRGVLDAVLSQHTTPLRDEDRVTGRAPTAFLERIGSPTRGIKSDSSTALLELDFAIPAPQRSSSRCGDRFGASGFEGAIVCHPVGQEAERFRAVAHRLGAIPQPCTHGGRGEMTRPVQEPRVERGVFRRNDSELGVGLERRIHGEGQSELRAGRDPCDEALGLGKPGDQGDSAPPGLVIERAQSI